MAGYYIRRGDKVAGPNSTDQLKLWASEGKLLPTDEIAKEPGGPWSVVAKTKLAQALPAASTAMVPQQQQAASVQVPAVVEAPAAPPTDMQELAGPVFAILRASKVTARVVTQPIVKAASATKSAIAVSSQRRHEIKLAKLANERIAAERDRELAKQQQPAPVAPQPQVMAQMPPGYQQPVINITNVNTNVIGQQQGYKRWSPAVAALLSLIFPGLGQLYKGQLLNGVIWCIVVLVGYAALIVPGLVLHLCCILGAASGDPYR
ncbi:MAG TPA: hypothetical protein VHD36_06350 [Pirellulales bacterium]|nr:hypothetical protein [Pirellulales bacterium]